MNALLKNTGNETIEPTNTNQQKIKDNTKWRHFYQRFTGGTIEYDLGRYEKRLEQIRSHSFENDTDGQLKQKSRDLSARARAGVPLENLLVPAFALVAETFRRQLNMDPYDVQASTWSGSRITSGK